MLYGVKLMYTYSVGQQELRFYEESVLMIYADSFDSAIAKAEEYGKDSFDEYINPNNEKVTTIQAEVLDCFLAYEEENGVQEIYSAFHVNQSGLKEEDYYKLMTAQCSAEELYSLRNLEYSQWN